MNMVIITLLIANKVSTFIDKILGQEKSQKNNNSISHSSHFLVYCHDKLLKESFMFKFTESANVLLKICSIYGYVI